MTSLTHNLTTPPSVLDHSSHQVNLDGMDIKSNLAWDEFLAQHAAGSHVQSTLWSDVKALNGWRSKRVTVAEDQNILGGAQILIKRVNPLGAVGYIPQGPLLASNSRDVAEELLNRIRSTAKSQRLRILFVQPPEPGAIVDRLAANDFYPSPIETAPSATILVDLEADLDQILGRMPKGMRNRVRRSQNRGISVRVGTKDDLPVFHRLLNATSQRHGFSTFELKYFEGMWDILSPSGNIQLFISEFDGEPVSAQFCIPFGDTVVAKQIGWSGKHGRLHPNEALDWFTIQWAKTHGYRFYDLEGIERPAAEAMLKGEKLPAAYAETPTAYKVRLGGQARLNPGSFCYVPNPAIRSLYKLVGNPLGRMSWIQKAAGRFRTG